MKIIKNYVIPIVAGALAGMVVLWAFESFSAQNRDFFINRFLQSFIIASIVVVLLNMKNRR